MHVFHGHGGLGRESTSTFVPLISKKARAQMRYGIQHTRPQGAYHTGAPQLYSFQTCALTPPARLSLPVVAFLG